jgi:RNA polymerase sigma-70 factor (ECF subfamily)
MSESVDTRVLIDRWRHGDQDAAREIVQRYIDRLMALARRRLSQRLASRLDPEDIVQSVFRTFFGRLKHGQFTFGDKDDVCKLLVRITLHKTLRQVAFHKMAKRDPAQEVNPDHHPHAVVLEILSEEPTAEATVAFVDELEHLLNQLQPLERQVVELLLQGHSKAEIARTLGIIERRVYRVIERVQAVARQDKILAPWD